MRQWKPIAIAAFAGALGAFSFVWITWQDVGRASVQGQTTASPPLLFSLASPARPQVALVSAGTRIAVRLEHTISTERNSSGDRFAASLSAPLWIDDQFLAPSRSKVIGQLINVRQLGRVVGSASLTMILRTLIVDGKAYDLETEPLIVAARSAQKKDAVIAGGTAVGEATKSEPLVYGPDSIFTFTLSSLIKLPVIRRRGGGV